MTLLVRLIALRFPGVDVPFLARLVPWMPFAVRMHLGVSLVGLLSMGVYLSPAMDLEPTVGGIALGVTMGAVAFLMITGWHARAAAALLVAAGPLGMLEFGVGPVAQRADLLGLAVFVLFTGAGPLVGRRRGRPRRRALARRDGQARSGRCASAPASR